MERLKNTLKGGVMMDRKETGILLVYDRGGSMAQAMEACHDAFGAGEEEVWVDVHSVPKSTLGQAFRETAVVNGFVVHHHYRHGIYERFSITKPESATVSLS